MIDSRSVRPSQSWLVGGCTAAILLFFISLGGCWVWFSPSVAPRETPTSATPTPRAAAAARYTEERGRSLEFTSSNHQACRQRLNSLGEKMLQRSRRLKFWPQTFEYPEAQRICPASGAAYEVFYVGNEAMLYCPGHDFKGFHSMRWLSQRKWVDHLTPQSWQNDLALAVLERDRFHPREALDLSLRSYSLKKTGNSLLMALIAAVDLDDHVSIEHLTTSAKSIPQDLWAQITLIHGLGYLGRFEESQKLCSGLEKKIPGLRIVTQRIRGLIALAQNRSDQAIAHFQKTGRDFGWANVWVYLARKDFQASLSLAQAKLRQEGFSHVAAIDWVRMATLSGKALGGEKEQEGRALLAEGLRKCRTTWPYPILLYLNRDISEEELRRRTPDFAEEQVRVDVTLGVAKTLEGQIPEGRADLARVRQAWSLDTFVAKAWSPH